MKTNHLYQRYSPQLAKTLEGMQKWILHSRHDFGLSSIIGDEIIRCVNTETNEYESRFGLRRVYPGQLVWEREVEIDHPGRWADDSRHEVRKEKLVVSRYTQAMIRRIVYEHIPVAQASVEQLKVVIKEFLDQGYAPEIDDLVSIGGIRAWLAEQILVENGQMAPKPRWQPESGFSADELRARIVEKILKISSRKPKEVELMVDDLLSVRERAAPLVERLEHGQIVGISFSRHQNKLYRRSMREIRKITDIVNLVTKEEEEALTNGGDFYKTREKQIVRMASENYERCQGVYSITDLALKLGISESRVSNIISRYEHGRGELVPRSGSIFDAGPTLTHKVRIINLLEDGVDVRAVKVKTGHTEEAIFRYSKRYMRVKELATKRDAVEIHQRTGISVSEVRAYLEILKTREPRLRIKEYEKAGYYDREDEDRVKALLSVVKKEQDLTSELMEKITGIPGEKIDRILQKLSDTLISDEISHVSGR